MPKRFKPVVKDTTVYVQGRLSYVHLLEPAAPQGSDQKCYSTCVLIDVNDKESVAAVGQAVKNAVAKGVVTKWQGKEPRKLQTPLRDGAEKEGPEFRGKVFFNAKANRAPAVLNRAKAPILSHDEVYSGMWAIVCVNMYPYSNSGNNGVAAGLNAVLKTADDTVFAGGDGSKAFDGINVPEDDDDDDLV